MKLPEPTHTRAPLAMDGKGAVVAEILEERTEEMNLDLDVELVEEGRGDGPRADPPARDAVVRETVQDDSAGALSARDLAARRSRRATVQSEVPSQLAMSMKAVPRVGTREISRRALEAEQMFAQPRRDITASVAIPVTALIERACAHMQRGEIGQALIAADEALTLNERAGQLAPAQMKDIAGGPLAPIFMPGRPFDKVPVVASSERELDAVSLDELQWALLRRIDGQKTIDQVFATTKIPAIDALKIAASLFRAGVVGLGDRRLS